MRLYTMRPGLMRDAVYNTLRTRVLRGELPVNAPLRESELTALVGASRTPVREALVRLRAEGLLVETLGGLVVRQFSEHDIMEVYEVRVPLETLAARLAAERLTPVHLAQIEALEDKFAGGARQRELDSHWLAAVNLELHRAICQAAGNALLLEVMSRIYDSIGRFSTRSFGRPERVLEAVGEHHALVTAIAAQNPDRAEQIARHHMRRAMAHRLEIVREAHRGATPRREGRRRRGSPPLASRGPGRPRSEARPQPGVAEGRSRSR
jgi:DNA-binding GntR family transcriptional regulator